MRTDAPIGPIGGVFHELISEGVHLDLYIVPPTGLAPSEEHPLGTDHYTIVTGGLSVAAGRVYLEGTEKGYVQVAGGRGLIDGAVDGEGVARSGAADPQVKAEAQLAVTTLERGLAFLEKR